MIIAEYVRRFPNMLIHHRHVQRRGATENYRFLIGAARGEYIAHLDGDDFWMPGKLRRQIAFLDANPDCTAVYSNALVVDDRREFVGVFSGRHPAKLGFSELLRRGNFLNTSSMVFRASERDSLLAIDGDFIDYQIHLRLLRNGKLGYLNAVLANYRKGSSGSALVHANDLVRECYWKALLDVPESVGDGLRAKAMADFLSKVFFRALRTRDATLMRSWWGRVISKAPVDGLHLGFATWGRIFHVATTQLARFVGSLLSGNRGRWF